MAVVSGLFLEEFCTCDPHGVVKVSLSVLPPSKVQADLGDVLLSFDRFNVDRDEIMDLMSRETRVAAKRT